MSIFASYRLIKLPEARDIGARDKKLFAALKEEFQKLDDLDSKFHKFNIDLFGAITDRLELHRDVLLRATRRNSVGSLFLAITIPVGSATLTWCVTNNYPTEFTGVFGLIITILTILNAVFRPTERLMTASHLLVSLHDWEMDMVIGLLKLLIESRQIEEELKQIQQKGEMSAEDRVKKNNDKIEKKNETYGFLSRKDKDLSEFGGSIVDRLLQMDISERGTEEKRK